MVVIVQDVQDVPPIFTTAPPVTRLPAGLLPGDKVRNIIIHDIIIAIICVYLNNIDDVVYHCIIYT